MLVQVDTHSLSRSAGETRSCASNIGDQIDAIRWVAASVDAADLIESNVGFNDQPHVVGMLAGVLDEVRSGAESADSFGGGLLPTPAMMALSAWLATTGTAKGMSEKKPKDCNYFPYEVSTSQFVISADGIIKGEIGGVGVYLGGESEIYGEVTVDSAGNYVVNIGGQGGLGVGLQGGVTRRSGSASGRAGSLALYGVYQTYKFSSKEEYEQAMSDLQESVKNDASAVAAVLRFSPLGIGGETTPEVLARLWKDNGVSTTATTERVNEVVGELDGELVVTAMSSLAELGGALDGQVNGSDSVTGYITVPAHGSDVVVGVQIEANLDADLAETAGPNALGVGGVFAGAGIGGGVTGSHQVDIHMNYDGGNPGATVTTDVGYTHGTTRNVEVGQQPIVFFEGRSSEQTGQTRRITAEYAGGGSVNDIVQFALDAETFRSSSSVANVTVQTLNETTSGSSFEGKIGPDFAGVESSSSIERTTTETVSSQFTPAGGSPIDQVATEGGRSCEIE